MTFEIYTHATVLLVCVSLYLCNIYEASGHFTFPLFRVCVYKISIYLSLLIKSTSESIPFTAT